MDCTASPVIRKPHVLVLPLPAPGHINPMLNFAKQLAARGFVITFVNTDKAHKRMLEARSQSSEEGDDNKRLDIRFAAIPDGSQEPLPGTTSQQGSHLSGMGAMLKAIESQQGVIEEMVVSSRATSYPITCIISDSFFPWARTLASKLGIQQVMFWAANGASLAIGVEMKVGKLKLSDVNDLEIVTNEHVTAGVSISRSDFLSSLPLNDPERVKLFVDRLSGLEDTTCIVVNTFEELEGSSLAAVELCGTKVHYVGPIMPPLNNDGANLSVNFYKEESSCIAWLDKQVPSSVLYVSFGSIASLATHELEELAFGIEESKQAFLWVSRDNNEIFPDGFLERIGDRGLVVKWAPQIQVLEHVAIGGFLTHCGWNSIVESIHMGVPMLCYPMINDQHLNALLVTRVWKLGIGLSKEKENGLIRREEIQRAVLSVLHSKELHQNSTTWRSVTNRALQQDGSSYIALQSIIDDLITFISS